MKEYRQESRGRMYRGQSRNAGRTKQKQHNTCMYTNLQQGQRDLKTHSSVMLAPRLYGSKLYRISLRAPYETSPKPPLPPLPSPPPPPPPSTTSVAVLAFFNLLPSASVAAASGDSETVVASLPGARTMCFQWFTPSRSPWLCAYKPSSRSGGKGRCFSCACFAAVARERRAVVGGRGWWMGSRLTRRSSWNDGCRGAFLFPKFRMPKGKSN